MRLAVRLAVAACVALALAGCGRSASYRYKLTLSLNTPEGVKTGYNVVEARYGEFSFPMKGEPHDIWGEGIYIDLGPGRRPLVALLTNAPRPDEQIRDMRWWDDVPTDIFVRLCLHQTTYRSGVDTASTIAAGCKAPFGISKSDLPDLVTFDDANDPGTVRKVDPDRRGVWLGPDISWRSMTLQATDEPLTTGIESHLPWISTMTGAMHLDGGTLGFGLKGSLANSLQTRNFMR
jgi:hypothetical protein